MFKNLKKFLDKFPVYGPIWENAYKGKWRVKYNNGKYSQKFCYTVAKDYAELFGGVVVYEKEIETSALLKGSPPNDAANSNK